MITPLLAIIDAVAATNHHAWAAVASVADGSLVGLSLGLTGGGHDERSGRRSARRAVDAADAHGTFTEPMVLIAAVFTVGPG